MLRSSQEKLFAFQCRALKLPAFEQQYLFAKVAFGRLWTFDFCWVEPYRLAVEIEGVVYESIRGRKGKVASGRHVTEAGFEEDCVKYYHALRLQYAVLRVTPKMVRDGRAVEMTQRLLSLKGWKHAQGIKMELSA